MSAQAISNSSFTGFSTPVLLTSAQKKASESWKGAGLSNELFVADPDCGEQIVKLHLHHTLRNWQGIFRKNSHTEQLEVLVEGVWKLAAPFFKDLKENREAWESVRSPGEIWCCTSSGFERRNPAKWEEIPIVAKLNTEQLEYARSEAVKLPSPLAKKETDCVLEIISGEKKAPSSELRSGVRDIYDEPAHPFIRLIDKKGNVISGGFWPSRPFGLAQFFSSCPGEFRFPDSYEGIPVVKRKITRIGISKEQHEELTQVIKEYNRSGREFNMRHNCTAFVSDILHRVGFKVDVHIFLIDLLGRCFPLCIQKLFSPLKCILDKIRAVAKRIFEASRAYLPAKTPHPTAFIGSSPKNYLYYPLPKQILEWQKEQPSTRDYIQGTPFVSQYC